MARPRRKCRWCTFKAANPQGLAAHERHCDKRPLDEGVIEVHTNGNRVTAAPSVADIKADIALEQATAMVLFTKFPKGIKTPDEHLRAVRIVKAVEHG